MALRYEYPKGAELPPPHDRLVRAPALREPAVVEFRRGVPLAELVQQVLSTPHCKLVGKTGVGKSTVIPKALASLGKTTVFHVTAHPLLALSAARFFSDHPGYGFQPEGLQTLHLQSQSDVVRPGALVWSGAAVFVAWLAAQRQREELPLRDSVVVLDEAHESDAYTHVVRSLALAMGARSLVLMSATFDAEGHTVVNENLVQRVFPDGLSPAMWDVGDHSKPWGVAQIRKCALIYVDSGSAASELAKAYSRAGVVAHRLTARSAVAEFDRAVRDLNDATGPVCVLLLDSSYRSGFNFDVTEIIDSGVVYYVEDGEHGLRHVARGLYNFEYVQTAGRGGRFGTKVVYSRPDVELPWKICDLGAVEMEAAAYLFRCLGFEPVGTLRATVMAVDDFPVHQDPVAALSGCYPLAGYCRDRYGRRLEGVRPVSPSASAVARGVAARSVGGSSSSGTKSRRSAESVHEGNSTGSLASSSGATGTVPMLVKPEDGSVDDMLMSATWSSVIDAVERGGDAEVSMDGYLFCPQLADITGGERSIHFPDGSKSVLEFYYADKLLEMKKTLPRAHREYALMCVLNELNMLNVETAAVRQAIVESVRGRENALAYRDIQNELRYYVLGTERLEMRKVALRGAARLLAGRSYVLEEMDRAVKAEHKRAGQYVKVFDAIFQKERRSADDEVDALQQRFEDLPPPSRGRGRLMDVEVEVRRRIGSSRTSSWTGFSKEVYYSDGSVKKRPASVLRRMSGVRSITYKGDGKTAIIHRD